MFQNNARIENLTGIRFYEQDILYDDHTYTGDIEIVIKADYVSPGFGIALLNNEGLSLQEQKELFLFRTGFRESSIIYKYGYSQKYIKRVSTSFDPPQNDIYFTFSKQGKYIKLFCSTLESPLLEYTLPNNNWDKYSLGIYSNAGNVIKNISIAASIPKNWVVNMYNTEGGYIKFIKSGFELIGCKNNAEMEQNHIPLKKGTYYLKYDVDQLKPSDIKAYVFLSGDDSLNNDKKNLLVNGSSFTLEEDTAINIKFAGKNGLIRNINLCENLYDQYLATKDENSKINGSYIKVDLKETEYITWTGKVFNLPDEKSMLQDSEKPYVVCDELDKFDLKDLHIELNKMYIFTYFINTSQLRIQDFLNTSNIQEFSLSNKATALYIYNNMDALITDFKIKKSNKKDPIDLIEENITKKHVERDISSPIIVVDNENIPLDLSSSYRFVNVPISDKDPSLTYQKYLFTNIEREIFETSDFIRLTNLPSREPNKIKIYGIYKNAKVKPENFFAISKEGINDLVPYTADYAILDNSKISYVNANTGEIQLADVDSYEAIIVDYEKRGSYCINYLPEASIYEVEIANEQQPATLFYDGPIMKNGILELEEYKTLKTDTTTLMKPVDKQYIVLRKEWDN